LEYCEQDYARAQAYYEQALGGLRELGTMREEPFGVLGLALTRLQQGDLTHAHALFCECFELYKSRGNSKGMAETLIGFGALASERGMQAEAVHLLTAAISPEDLFHVADAGRGWRLGATWRRRARN
jgi:hypothetical protein